MQRVSLRRDESHSAARMHAVFDRPDVVYRDMFWVQQKPLHYKLFDLNFDNGYFPILHETSCLTFNDDERFGREQVDVELREPLLEDSDHILVSLRQLARWHISENLPAEMLRESGKFDFSEPHFFHMFGMPAHRQQQSKPYLRWALEARVTHSIIDVSTGEPVVVYTPSTHPSDYITVSKVLH